MNAAIVENNMITNVVVLPEGADPAAFGAYSLPEGKWIGDPYAEEPEEAVTWAALDAAYREGVSTAYDS